MLGIAKAFATGPQPKRSVVFVWHAGEEAGLAGLPLQRRFPGRPARQRAGAVQHRHDRPQPGRQRERVEHGVRHRRRSHQHRSAQHGDRHQRDFAKPLDLDFEYNDPADPNSFYTRSDHYSYASKGIPIAFFFTGTHLDYHCVTDQWTRSCSRNSCRSRSSSTRPGSTSPTATDPRARQQGPPGGRGYSTGQDRQVRQRLAMRQ